VSKKPKQKSFLGISENPSKARFIVVPANIGGTSVGRKGAEKAPEKIISASWQLEDFDTETKTIFVQEGIATESSCKNLNQLAKKVEKIISDGRFPVVIGGEHLITHQVLKVLKKFYGSVGAIFFDAHADMFPEFDGKKIHHACALYLSLPYLDDFLCIGVRNLSPVELEEIKAKNLEEKFLLFEDFFPNYLGQTPSLHVLTDKLEKIKTNAIYISFDFDFVDPSAIPSLSTPEPPGFSFRETLDILKKIISFFGSRIKGADFVEFCPDENFFAEVSAAKIISKTICYISLFSK
jgi:agmatinase